ncbi:MAG: hypothetical protein HYZ53_21750 [Planctomycetes bacterium]|nr:hypothetical protein [Planctomycetota bacterium]
MAEAVGQGRAVGEGVTAAERIVCAMARWLKDGDLVAQGIATPLVASAYRLAHRTHAPHLLVASAIGNSLTARGAPLGIESAEEKALSGCLHFFGFVDAACQFLPYYNPKEFFRPAQVDRHGNFNNVAIGEYATPLLRLPGSGGIPDVTNYSKHIYLYVPRQIPESFVERVDFVSGIGHRPGESQEERRRRGVRSPGPSWIVTDLCTMDFVEGELRIATLHRGVAVADVKARMGFEPKVADPLPETTEPTAAELLLLREEIDPLGLRDLELLGGKERVALMRRAITAEREVAGAGG